MIELSNMKKGGKFQEFRELPFLLNVNKRTVVVAFQDMIRAGMVVLS